MFTHCLYTSFCIPSNNGSYINVVKVKVEYFMRPEFCCFKRYKKISSLIVFKYLLPRNISELHNLWRLCRSHLRYSHGHRVETMYGRKSEIAN
jgi:hypothetical protein